MNYCSQKANFTQSKAYIFITRNGGKLYFLAVLIIIITASVGFKRDFQIYRLLYILALLTFAVLLTGNYLRRVACGIIIDFKTNTIKFDMCRAPKAVLPFKDILEIQIRRNVIFILRQKKIIYNGIQDKSLIESLSKLERTIKDRGDSGPH